ncbi:hypothetical protein ON011_003430 [Providencia rettgeri]|nr:hypothetical protein [Providencia rettgeri]
MREKNMTSKFRKKPTNNAATSLNEDAATSFINGAPDGKAEEKKGVVKGKKHQITITMTPELIAQIDTAAAENGQSRAAWINMSCINTLNNGLQIQGKKQ